jgi:hypothetical protein
MNRSLLSLRPSVHFSSFFICFWVVGLALTSSLQAQVANYAFSESFGNVYEELVGGTEYTGDIINTNSLPELVSLGFDFNFNGNIYTQLYVAKNGFVTFNNAPAESNIRPIGNTAVYDGAISGYGANLRAALLTTYPSALPSITYGIQGVSPNRVFVVQYKDMVRMNGPSRLPGLLNFQIRLYEATSSIEVHYVNAEFSTTSTSNIFGQVGLRGSNNLDINARNFIVGSRWPATTAITTIPHLTTEGLLTNTTIGYRAGTRFVWTPCLPPTGFTAVVLGDNETAALSWTAPSIPPAGYMYEIRSSGAPGSGATGLFASGTTTDTSVNIPGLQIGITYTVYLKSVCAVNWITGPNLQPTCDIATLPYVQNFEGVITPSIPNCTNVQAVSGAAMVTVDGSVTPYFGFNTKYLRTNSFAATNTWYFTKQIHFPAPGVYKVTYTYGGSRELPQFTQRMRVGVATANTPAAMTANIIANHNEIKQSPLTQVVHFTIDTPGDYYVGFNGYADSNNGNLMLDDIRVEPGVCDAPTDPVSAQITGSSAIIGWTAPASEPSGGYQYFVATTASAIVPIATTTPSGSVGAGNVVATLSGLAELTQYNFWIRSVCGGGNFSVWSPLGTFTTLAQPTYCIPNGCGFLQDPNGITNVTFGSINNTTGLEACSYGNYSNLTTNVAQNTTVPVSITTGTGFTYWMHIWVDWNDDGVFDNATELMYTGETTNVVLNTLLASFFVPIEVDYGGGNIVNTLGPHRVRIGGTDFGPFQDPCRAGTWQVYEDYSIFVIPPPPPLELSGDEWTMCVGETSPLFTITTPLNSYQDYTWNPSTGVSGDPVSGYTFNPTSTTTYVLTGTQTSGNFWSNSDRIRIIVNQRPTPIVVLPIIATVCEQGPPVMLTATGGIVSGVVVFEENFNDENHSFTTVNNSFGGNTTCGAPCAAWTLRPNNYNRPPTFRSNDQTQFILSDSDRQGAGGTTNTTMTSPSFSLVGYTEASLSFWHFYRGFSNGAGRVQVSIDEGASWTSIQSFTTATSGSATAFVNIVLNLTPFVGNANVQIRFNYENAQYAWYWAIDNVRVTGSAISNITWTPTTGLFTNVAGTIAYTGGAASVVYAKPGVNTVYTATAVTAEGCDTSTSVTVNANVIVEGTVSATQGLCYGSPEPIVLSGHGANTVVRWEYANNNLFTLGVTPIVGSAGLTTLPPELMGTFFEDRYFRAVVTDGICQKTTNVVGVFYDSTVFNGTSWTNFDPDAGAKAIFNVTGNYTITGPISACSLLIFSGNITVASGVTLSIENEVVITPGATLIFENNASLLQGFEEVSNSGTIEYRRNSTGMYLHDYTYWSSPVENQDLYNFSPFTNWRRTYEWDGSIQDWVQAFTTQADHAAGYAFSTAGLGFIVRAPGGGPLVFNSHLSADPRVEYPAVFMGIPNNGTYTVNVYSGGDGWNLLGNPYPSALDIHAFLLDPANANLDGTVKFWTHNTPITAFNYNPSDYATYNFTGVTGSGTAALGFNSNLPSRFIASGQGVVIDALADGTVTYRNSHRVAGSNTNFFRLAEGTQAVSQADAIDSQEKHRVWLSMTNNQDLSKELLVGYVQNATNAWDRGYDGKFTPSGYGIEFYSLLGDTQLAIQGKGLPFAVTDVVPLGFHATQAGGYSIQLNQFDGLFQTQEIYIEDLLTGNIHPLKESNYSFVTEAGRFDQRFVLRYTNETLNVNTPHFDENNVVVYKQEGKLVVHTVGASMQEVVLYDVSGRTIARRSGDLGFEVVFDPLGIAQQVVLIEVTTLENGVMYKKYVY